MTQFLTADDVVAIHDAEDPSRACPEHGRDADIYDIAMSVAEGVLDVTRLAERLKVFAVPVPPLPSASDDDPPETITMPGAQSRHRRAVTDAVGLTSR